jgi:hypothetical protein
MKTKKAPERLVPDKGTQSILPLRLNVAGSQDLPTITLSRGDSSVTVYPDEFEYVANQCLDLKLWMDGPPK